MRISPPLLFIDSIREFYSTSSGVLKVILTFGFSFIFLSAGFFAFILVRRFYMAWRTKRATLLRNEIEKLVDAIMQGKIKSFAFESETNKLIQSYTNHSFLKNEHRNILINELVTIYKTIGGSAADNLREIFISHDLPKYSLHKLKNYRWYIKAKGIQELADMNITEACDEIEKYINHPKSLLRTEAQTAMVKLANFDALRFLDETTYPISEWLQLKFLHILANKEVKTLPDFSHWLRSTNDTVVIFTLKLIRHFQSIQLSDDVVKALAHKNLNVRIAAVETLGTLHHDSALNLIKEQFYKDEKEFKIKMLHCFNGIFKPKDFSFLEVQLLSFDYDLSLSAAKAIISIGAEGVDFINKIYASYADSMNKQIIKHALAETN